MNIEQRIAKLHIDCRALSVRLDKINSCHSAATGEFCSTGGGGGAAVGTHVLKVAGNKREAADLVASISELDKAFGGKLLPALENHPLPLLKVYNTAVDRMAHTGGAYNIDKGTLIIRSKALMTPKAESIGYTVMLKEGKTPGKEQLQLSIFTHELGHHIQESAIRKNNLARMNEYANNKQLKVPPPNQQKDRMVNTFNQDAKSGKAPSEYAKTSFSEYFAEVFAQHPLDKKVLSPQARSMVEKTLSYLGSKP